jgi:hypothetical protein
MRGRNVDVETSPKRERVGERGIEVTEREGLKRRNRRAKLLLLGNVMIGKRNRKKIGGDSRRDRRKRNKRRRMR